MSFFESSLYQGTVRHTRLEPISHGFEYKVYYGFFDIDELERLAARLKTFSLSRFNLFGFDPRDHGVEEVKDLRPWAETVLAEAGVDIDGGPIKLLAFPRVLGYVFNPLSVWYCYAPDGALRGVIHEVRNTFGDRHVYVVPIRAQSDLRHEFAKRMHVSPFNGLDQTYRFTVNEPGERLAIGIELADSSGKMFRAGMRLTRVPISDLALARMFLTHPLITLRVIVGIHWQALRLWLKGARYRKTPAPPALKITIVNHLSLST